MLRKPYCVFCVFFLFSCSLSLSAQNQKKPISSKDLFFAREHNRFEAAVYLSKGKVSKEYGDADLKNKLGFGFSFTWIHTWQINDAWAIEGGLGYGALPFRYYHNTPADTLGSFDILNYGTEYIEYLKLPIQAVFRKPLGQKLFLNFRPGFSIRYVLLQELDISEYYQNKNLDYVEEFNSVSTFANAPRLNFNLGLGLSWVLPYFDMLDFQLQANISPSYYMFTDYYFFPGSP